jgi:hypothetical protein
VWLGSAGVLFLLVRDDNFLPPSERKAVKIKSKDVSARVSVGLGMGFDCPLGIPAGREGETRLLGTKIEKVTEGKYFH